MSLPAPRFSTIILFSFARMILRETRSLALTDFGRRLSCSGRAPRRAEAHTWWDRKSTSELQSHSDVVCRLLLEKKKLDSRQTGGPGMVQATLCEHKLRDLPLSSQPTPV